MKTKNCPFCNKEIDIKANRCINCGKYLIGLKPQSSYIPGIVFAVILFLFLFIAIFIMRQHQELLQKEQPQGQQQVNPNQYYCDGDIILKSCVRTTLDANKNMNYLIYKLAISKPEMYALPIKKCPNIICFMQWESERALELVSEPNASEPDRQALSLFYQEINAQLRSISGQINMINATYTMQQQQNMYQEQKRIGNELMSRTKRTLSSIKPIKLRTDQ